MQTCPAEHHSAILVTLYCCADTCAQHVTLIPECQDGVPHQASANQCDR